MNKSKLVLSSLCLLMSVECVIAQGYQGKLIRPCVEVSTNQVTDTTIMFKFVGYKDNTVSCLYTPGDKGDGYIVYVKIPDDKVGKFCGAPVLITPKASSSNGDFCASEPSLLSVVASGLVTENGQPSYNFFAKQDLAIAYLKVTLTNKTSPIGWWINEIDGVVWDPLKGAENALPFTKGLGFGDFTVELTKATK